VETVVVEVPVEEVSTAVSQVMVDLVTMVVLVVHQD
tara:strand:+ start:407 stop:514 length:108 start_codon:yes stop_codon:yes gene_type:complete